jgi:hypothetical protein
VHERASHTHADGTTLDPHCSLSLSSLQAAPTPSLAMQSTPHDALRMGLPSLKEDVAPRHPVDEVQTTVRV